MLRITLQSLKTFKLSSQQASSCAFLIVQVQKLLQYIITAETTQTFSKTYGLYKLLKAVHDDAEI